jgi:hypothetical protein
VYEHSFYGIWNMLAIVLQNHFANKMPIFLLEIIQILSWTNVFFSSPPRLMMVQIGYLMLLETPKI